MNICSPNTTSVSQAMDDMHCVLDDANAPMHAVLQHDPFLCAVCMRVRLAQAFTHSPLAAFDPAVHVPGEKVGDWTCVHMGAVQARIELREVQRRATAATESARTKNTRESASKQSRHCVRVC
jgi:hypothetical protein